MELDRRILNGLLIEAAEQAVSEGVPPGMSRRLDDEHPVIPLAADADGDVAMVTLLTWTDQDSGRQPGLWNQDLLKHNDGWHPVSGSGGRAPRDYPLTARRPAAPPGLHIRVYEAGPQQSMNGDKTWLTAALYVTAEVETLRVGDRQRPVPFHGYLPVVVRNRAEAVVAAIASDGSVLETIDLRSEAADLYRALIRRDPGGWPFTRR
jgi:hypothetical protein